MRLFWAVLAALAIAIVPGMARAWNVGSGVTPACHERFMGEAYSDSVLDFVPPQFSAPDGEVWRRLSSHLLRTFPIDYEKINAEQRFLLVSLMTGVRAPDTDGHSITNLENLHLLHGDPSPQGQYLHSLRGPDDDYDAGCAAAVAGTRQAILDLVALGQTYVGSDAPIIKVPIFLDFYGRIDIQVHAPAFYMGQAAHALQDTFSHTLRDKHDDYRSIVQVLNYIDAIGSDMQESRDGPAHSNAMDNCDREDMAVLAAYAVLATEELLFAARAQYSGQDPDAVLKVLDKWVTLKPGCNLENDFCNNPEMRELARSNPTRPYLEEIFGCSSARTGGAGTLAILFLLLFTGLRWRWGRRIF